MTALLLGIDPGTEQSGFVVLCGDKVMNSGVVSNLQMLESLKIDFQCCASMAIEMVASYGMPVGKDVFETVRWIGRFQQQWHSPEQVVLVYRQDVKQNLCKSAKANDASIRQALIDRFGPVGTKKNQGPLYGVTSHAWSALAVAVTAQDQQKGLRRERRSLPVGF